MYGAFPSPIAPSLHQVAQIDQTCPIDGRSWFEAAFLQGILNLKTSYGILEQESNRSKVRMGADACLLQSLPTLRF